MNFLAHGRFFWLFPILIWGVLTTLSAQWNLNDLDDMAESLAYERAKSMFSLVQMTRLWNAQHEGIYVPITKATPPNPYLEDYTRDVETSNGVKLTKLNPAYMTRQISDVAKQFAGILFHITSLKPLNPGNAPDSWELEALRSFEQGAREVLEYIPNNGLPTYRYMGPLLTKKACMKCHEKQGYKVGDVRGGISITLSAEPILNAQNAARTQVLYIHVTAFILLSATTLFLLIKLRQQWRLVNETKEQLAGREHFLRSITEAAGEGVVTMDKNGTVTFFNPEAKRLLGWDEPAGTTDRELAEEKLEKIQRSKESVAKSAIKTETDSMNVVRVDEGRFIHSEGHKIPVSYVASPILQGSAITGTVILFQDITLRKKMEKRLVRLETMSALGSMVAGVAHEVNTPVGVSVTSASYLAGRTKDLLTVFEEETLTRSAMKAYLETSTESTTIILSNLKRAAEMIKGFKQIAVDQTSEARSRFDLKEYLDSVLLTLRPELKKTALKITVHCPENIEIDSYPGALSQVITNLIMNSKIHAFAEGEAGTLTFDIKKSGENIHIQYSDNGKGIPEEHLEEIFSPFVTTRRGKGSSGLGLHISQNLVHTILKGSITVSSQLNKGSQFTLTIPVSPN